VKLKDSQLEIREVEKNSSRSGKRNGNGWQLPCTDAIGQ